MSSFEHDRNPPPQRRESDREDILREAVALKRRAAFCVEGLPSPLVVGFRTNGYFSVFLDQDPVYQFDDQGRLRRAFHNGSLFRTQGETLAQLTRTRTANETILQRHDLEPRELQVFLEEMAKRLLVLQAALMNGTQQTVASVPEGIDITEDVLRALRSILEASEPLAPPLPTRRD